MKTIRKLMPMSYNYYKEIEQKLEHYAKKGLILEKIGSTFWIFKKAEPQNLKYTVTYFSEGSVFNPHPTDNQQTYFDYAKEAGWDFICEYNKMQIFSSTLENPPEFETDEKEKLENLHKCMKKSLVLSQLLMLVIFALNLFLRLDSLKRNPTDFLSSNIDLATLLMFFSIIIYSSYYLITYYVWYTKSKKSVDLGGSIIDNFSKIRRYFDIVYLVFLFSIVGYIFVHLFNNSSLGIITISLVQLPLFALVFLGSITLLKRRKIAAKANRIISILLLILTGVLYISFVFFYISQFSFPERSSKPYTSVDWQMYEGMTREYRLYCDKIPLTCADLYGDIDFKYYSFEAENENTVFLQKEHYSQTCPPMKNAPPELEYYIYKPKFGFVKNIIISDLTRLDDWSDKKVQTLNNDIFSTESAFAFYYEEDDGKHFTGEYILVFENQIVNIDAETYFTDKQIEIVKNKLLIGQ